MQLVLGAFLLGHAIVHIGFVSPAPPRTADGPEWPFEMTRSWLVTVVGLSPDIVRALGTLLVAMTVVLLASAGPASLGWLVPAGAWPLLVTGGAVASLLTLAVFFHPWLLAGLAIDAALLWAVLVVGWSPTGSTP